MAPRAPERTVEPIAFTGDENPDHMIMATTYRLIALDEGRIERTLRSYPHVQLRVTMWDQQETLEWPVRISLTVVPRNVDMQYEISQEWCYFAEPREAALTEAALTEALTDMVLDTIAMANNRLKGELRITPSREQARMDVIQCLAKPPERRRGG